MMASFLTDPDYRPTRQDLESFLLNADRYSGLGYQTTTNMNETTSHRVGHEYGLGYDSTGPGKSTPSTFLQIYGATPLASDALRNSPTLFASSNAHTEDFATHTPTSNRHYTVASPFLDQPPLMMGDAAPPSMNVKAKPPHKKYNADTSSIRDKLSQIGVKVTDAKDAPAPTGPTQNSNTADIRAREDHTDKLVFRGRQGGRGGGRGGRPSHQQPRAARWPDKKTIPEPEPRQSKADDGGWGASSDWNVESTEQWAWSANKRTESPGESIDSARADGGCGQKKRIVDGDATNKLADFDGGWAPAPLDWDSRPAFREQQSEHQVQRWLDNAETAIASCSERAISFDAFQASGGAIYVFVAPDVRGEVEEMGDIVPRYWIPATVGRQNPRMFWEELMSTYSPPPLDEDDLKGVRPWWETLPPNRTFLDTITHPQIAGIDPDENLDERLLRETDYGGINHKANRAKFTAAKQEAEREKHKRQNARTKRLMARSVNRDRGQDDARLRLGLPKMIVRSARRDDLTAVRQIYNYYVRNTSAVQETEDLTEDDMIELFNDSQSSQFPFLVAFEKGEVIKPRKNKKNRDAEDIILPDTILGFAFADEYCNDKKSIYRFTAEIKVYTSQDYYQKGVASCLVDKMMAMLDPDYLERGGYPVQGEELEGVEPKRLIKNIMVNYLYEKPENLHWVARWLGDVFDFHQVGQVKGIGTKLGKPVNVALFQRSTGAQPDHSNPPAPGQIS